jgi:cytochrome c
MRICAPLFVFLVGLFCSSQAAAVANSSEAQALALIQQAQTYFKKHGQESAFAEFNRLDSPFNSQSDINPNGDLYLYTLDYKGYQAVHGKNPKIRGKVMMDMRDSEGVPLIQLMVAKCKSSAGKGWVTYKWPHPISKEVEPKKGYVERIAGTKVCLGTGVYQ